MARLILRNAYRDDAVKQELEERRLRRLQARAVANEWSSPQEKTRKV